jgi:hypothetical protein
MRSMLASGSTSSTTELLRRTIELTEGRLGAATAAMLGLRSAREPVWPTTERGPSASTGSTSAVG